MTPRMRHGLLAFGTYLAGALFLFQHALRDLGGRVVGGEDVEVHPFLWGFFWLEETLKNTGALPLFTPLMDHPYGGVIWVKEQLQGLILWPLIHLGGPTYAYTADQILHVVGASALTYALARQLKLAPIPAFFAGVFYGFSPHMLGEAYNGNLDAMNLLFSPLWLLALLRVWAQPGWGRALALAASLFLLLITNAYYATAMALATGPLVGLLLFQHRRSGLGRPLAFSFLGTAGGLLVFWPFGRRILASISAGNRLNTMASYSGFAPPHVTDALGLYAPFWQPTGGASLPFQDFIYVGLGVLGLSVVALFNLRRRPLWGPLFASLGLFFLSLSLGPALFHRGALVDWGGVVHLPWHWLITDNPVLSHLSLPHRMAMPASLCLALAAASALHTLRGHGRSWRSLAVMALALVATADILLRPPYAIPLETVPLKRPAHATLLAQLEAPGAVLNLPINLYSNPLRVYLWHQTLHRRPVADSFRIATWPSVVSEVPLLHQIAAPLSWDTPVPGPLRSGSSEDPMGITRMAEMGFGFIVFHGALYREQTRGDARQWQDALEQHLGPGLILPGGDILWALDPKVRRNLDLEARRILDEPAIAFSTGPWPLRAGHGHLGDAGPPHGRPQDHAPTPPPPPDDSHVRPAAPRPPRPAP